MVTSGEERLARVEAEGASALIGRLPLVFSRSEALCREIGIRPLGPGHLRSSATAHPVRFIGGRWVR